MPGDDSTKMAAALPQMEIKKELQPKNVRLVGRPIAQLNKV